MKKFLMVLLAITSLALTGCDVSRKYIGVKQWKHVHIYSGEVHHFNLSDYEPYENGEVRLTLKNGSTFIIEGNYILYDSDDCPLCGHVEHK